MPSRSRASRVSIRAVTRVVAVDSRWSSQTPRCSRAFCSTANAWSGSHCSRASCTTGPNGRDPVVAAGDGQVPVHERHRVGRELGGGPGDLAGLPRLQPAVLDQRPQPREPVAELDRLGHQRQPGRVGQVQGRGELLDRVLGHRRRADPGQRGPVEERRTQRRRQTAGTLGRERRRRMLVGGRVQVHPVHRQRQQPGLLRIRSPASGDGRVQHRRRVQVTHVGCGLGLVERGAGHA